MACKTISSWVRNLDRRFPPPETGKKKQTERLMTNLSALQHKAPVHPPDFSNAFVGPAHEIRLKEGLACLDVEDYSTDDGATVYTFAPCHPGDTDPEHQVFPQDLQRRSLQRFEYHRCDAAYSNVPSSVLIPSERIVECDKGRPDY